MAVIVGIVSRHEVCHRNQPKKSKVPLYKPLPLRTARFLKNGFATIKIIIQI